MGVRFRETWSELTNPCTWRFVMKKELSPKEVLALRCPTCGAAPGERCELSTGQPRTSPHRDRRWIAADCAKDPGTVAVER
jgi:hypothetical protein